MNSLLKKYTKLSNEAREAQKAFNEMLEESRGDGSYDGPWLDELNDSWAYATAMLNRFRKSNSMELARALAIEIEENEAFIDKKVEDGWDYEEYPLVDLTHQIELWKAEWQVLVYDYHEDLLSVKWDGVKKTTKELHELMYDLKDLFSYSFEDGTEEEIEIVRTVKQALYVRGH